MKILKKEVRTISRCEFDYGKPREVADNDESGELYLLETFRAAIIEGLLKGRLEIFSPAFMLDQESSGPEEVDEPDSIPKSLRPGLENTYTLGR